MADPDSAPDARRPLDERALAQVLARLRRAPSAPWLHAEVARRMAERLAAIRVQPAVVLDWWAGLSASRELLDRTYPKARVVAVEPAPVPLPARSRFLRWGAAARAPVAEAEVAEEGAQLVWANMVLHGCAAPRTMLAQWRRALAVDGFLMFSTLGPGSLGGLAAIYREAGWPPPFAPFVDMHDLGDMLVEAGFAGPVMDQETITLNWADTQALLAELRGLGGNVDPQRFGGLRTPRWRARLGAALASLAGADGRPALQFEIVYGHAFKPEPRLPLQAETRVPLQTLRAMARRGGRER